MNINKKCFDSLEGNWQLNRTLNDVEIIKGTAIFSTRKDKSPSYAYLEEGILSLSPENKLSFYREYIYCLTQNNIEVHFASQKKKLDLFLTLTFSSPISAQ